MNQPDLAKEYLDKAMADVAAMTLLASQSEITDEIIGFHAQQAVEKAVKAVLVRNAVRPPHIHNITLLADSLLDAGIPVPDEISLLEFLTDYAVDLRYVGEPHDPLDRAEVARLVSEVLSWAEGYLASG